MTEVVDCLKRIWESGVGGEARELSDVGSQCSCGCWWTRQVFPVADQPEKIEHDRKPMTTLDKHPGTRHQSESMYRS